MLRDLDQLRDAPPWGVTAVEGLLAVEASLCEAIRYVPYCAEHLHVWSPRFTQIILDAASQIDSLWRATTHLDDPTVHPEAHLNITNHFHRFGRLVAPQQVVFFAAESPSLIHPFEAWDAQNFFCPEWWKAYNALKHDRFSNQAQGTLGHAANAVAGLLLAIVYSGRCDVALVSGMLLDTTQDNRNPWAYARELRDVPFQCRAKIETRAFAHPLGVFAANDCNLSADWRSDSNRFNLWWAMNAKDFTV